MKRITTYTNAPPGYDGFGTRTELSCVGMDLGKVVRKVSTPAEHLEWQRARYASGMYSALKSSEWSKLKAIFSD